MIKNCKFCGKSFEAKRSTALFCETNCRVRYNDLSRQIEDRAINALDALYRLSEIMRKYPEFEDVIKAELKIIEDRALNLRITHL